MPVGGRDEMMAGNHVVVIGAGIVGMACAAFLRRDANAVTVIDEQAPGAGCSSGNAGSISPDMVVPMAMPGMLAKVPGWLIDPLGPLAIKPSYFPRALPWLFRWIAAGRMPQVRAASAALRALHKPVFETYRELLGDADFDRTIRTAGQLYVWRTRTPTEPERIADALRAACGVRTESISQERLREMEPSLSPDFARGLYFPDNGHTSNPQRLVATIAEQFARDGGVLLRRKALRLEVTGGGVSGVRTDQGPVSATHVVIAAGAWSLGLCKPIGVRVPLETERGYHVTLPEPGISIRNKLSNRDKMFSVTAMEDGMRLAGTVEIAGLDAPPNEARAHILLKQAKDMFPGVNVDGFRTWMGCRPSMPDSAPVIDRAPGAPNVILAFGHGHTGLTGAPMTGKLVADFIADRPPAIDPLPYRATRF